MRSARRLVKDERRPVATAGPSGRGSKALAPLGADVGRTHAGRTPDVVRYLSPRSARERAPEKAESVKTPRTSQPGRYAVPSRQSSDGSLPGRPCCPGSGARGALRTCTSDRIGRFSGVERDRSPRRGVRCFWPPAGSDGSASGEARSPAELQTRDRTAIPRSGVTGVSNGRGGSWCRTSRRPGPFGVMIRGTDERQGGPRWKSKHAPRTAGSGSGSKARAYPTTRRGRPEFPGCGTITLKCDEIATWEGRFELWDAATETAWVVREPTSAIHEFPSHRIPALGEVIASVRGSPSRASVRWTSSFSTSTASGGGSSRRTSRCTCIPNVRGCRTRGAWWWGCTTSPTWCWRWTTPRTSIAGSSGSMRSGAFRRCGWRCRNASRRAAPRGSGRGSPFTFSMARNTGRRARAGRFRAGPRTRFTWR